MITLCNITEARGKLSQIGSNIKQGSSTAFLKNGKILFVGVNPIDFKNYKKWQEEQKIKLWSANLSEKKISKKEAKSIADAREEIEKGNCPPPMSAKELMNIL